MRLVGFLFAFKLLSDGGTKSPEEALKRLYLETKELLPDDFEFKGAAVSEEEPVVSRSRADELSSMIEIIKTPSEAVLSVSDNSVVVEDPCTWAALLQREKLRDLKALCMRHPQIEDNGVAGYRTCLRTYPSSEQNKGTVLLIHGSFHSPSCFAELASILSLNGYATIAPYLRGTSKGSIPSKSNKRNKVKISEHVEDLQAFVASMSNSSTPVFPVAHSFSSLLLLKTLQSYDELPFRSYAIINGVPPSGNSAMTMRFLKRSLRKSFQITRGLALKAVRKEPALARTLFFDEQLPESELASYMNMFEVEGENTVDLLDLSSLLPSLSPPPVQPTSPPLVVHSVDDLIVDAEGSNEMRAFINAIYKEIKAPHDSFSSPSVISLAFHLISWLSNSNR